jgi:hypothetical protein
MASNGMALIPSIIKILPLVQQLSEEEETDIYIDKLGRKSDEEL